MVMEVPPIMTAILQQGHRRSAPAEEEAAEEEEASREPELVMVDLAEVVEPGAAEAELQKEKEMKVPVEAEAAEAAPDGLAALAAKEVKRAMPGMILIEVTARLAALDQERAAEAAAGVETALTTVITSGIMKAETAEMAEVPRIPWEPVHTIIQIIPR